MRYLYKIDRNLIINVQPVQKVVSAIIKKEEMEPKIDIAKIREEAEYQAAEIMGAAQQDAAEIEKSAYDKGYVEGYNTGEQKAKTDFQMMVTEGQNIIAESYAEREKMILEAEEAVVNLAIDIAKKIIIKEISQGDAFSHMVRAALGKLATTNRAKLLVNPDEYEEYFPDGNGEMITHNGVITFTVEANAGLPKGNCTIETEDGTIKAGVNEQLEKIRNTLLPMVVGDG